MNVTIFSFLSAIVWSSILIVLTYFLRKSRRLTQYFGVFSMFLLYVLCIGRMFFSFELTPTVIVESKDIYPVIYENLTKVYFTRNHIEISILDTLIAFWITISLVLLILYVMHYIKAFKILNKYTAKPSDARIYRTLNSIRRKNKKYKISVLLCSDTDIPFGVGILRKKIVLPNREYSDDELYYILLHEYTHFLNHDIIVKLMVSIFCIIFWWNPCVYLLKKDLEQTLEIKCDLAIIKHLGMEDRVSYLQAIIDSLKEISHTRKIPYITTSLLKSGHAYEVKERFQVVMSYPSEGTKQYSNRIFLLSMLGILGLSYMFLPQPVFEAPEITDRIDSYEFNSKDSYLVRTENGEYEIYIRGESRGILDEEFSNILINDGFQIVE